MNELASDGQRRGTGLGRVEEGHQLAFLVPEVRLHDGRDPVEVTEHLGRARRAGHPVQIFDQRRQHPVIIHQPVDHGAETGVSGKDVREHPRVLLSVVTGERAAEAEAEQPELLREFNVRFSVKHLFAEKLYPGAQFLVHEAQLPAPRLQTVAAHREIGGLSMSEFPLMSGASMPSATHCRHATPSPR